MGITCQFSLVNHSLLVERALPLLEKDGQETATCLREALLRSLAEDPWERDDEAIAVRRARLEKLESLNAPDIILNNERRTLAALIGEDRKPETVEGADLERLRVLVGGWGRHSGYCFNIDKAYDLIHWFCDGSRRQGSTSVDPPDFAKRSLIARTLYGSRPVPRLPSGARLWGSDDYCSHGAYNSPSDVLELSAYLEGVDVALWAEINEEMARVPEEEAPYASHGGDPEDLRYATHHFHTVQKAYQRAARRGLGISCDFG